MDSLRDHDMEKSFLSALLHNSGSIPQAFAIDKTPQLMDNDENRQFWQGMIEMQNKDLSVDPTSLVNYVTKRGYLDKKTAESRMAQVVQLQESAANIETWTEILADLKNRRMIRRACTDVKAMAADLNTSMDDVRRQMTDKMAASQNVERPDLLGDVALSLEERIDKDDFEGLSGTIKTGMRELDSVLGGIMSDDFIGILSRPGWGKSSFMIQVALGMKILYPEGIMDIFSIEMSEERITYRFVSQISGVPYGIVRKVFEEGADVGQADESKIRKALSTFQKWREEGSIRIYTGSKTPDQVCQMIRANAMKTDEEKYLGAFVDNFQRLHGMPSLEDKESAVKSLKDVTIDVNHPIFLLIQLNRVCESQGVPPKISHAKSVGQIEQDLDRGIIIDRPDERAKHETEARLEELGIKLNEAIIDVAKNRSGKPDTFSKFFHGPTMQFLGDLPFGKEGPPAAGRDPMGLVDSEEDEEADGEPAEPGDPQSNGHDESAVEDLFG